MRSCKVLMRLMVLCALVSTLIITALAQSGQSIEPLPRLLPVREQLKVREGWLKTRLDTMLLPMMRRHKIDMWIVTNEEFHPDPIVPHIAPPIPYQGRRDFFIFTDRGTDKLERIALVRYPEEHLRYFFEVLNPPSKEIASTLRRVVEERKPKAIGLNMGGTRGATSS